MFAVLSLTLFPPRCISFLQVLDCSEEGKLYATVGTSEDSYHTIECWTADHLIMTIFGMEACFFYIFTALITVLFFREPRSRNVRDIQYIGFFILTETVFKTVICFGVCSPSSGIPRAELRKTGG